MVFIQMMFMFVIHIGDNYRVGILTETANVHDNYKIYL